MHFFTWCTFPDAYFTWMPHVIGSSTAFGSHRNPIIFSGMGILPGCLEKYKETQKKRHPQNFVHLISDEGYRNRKKMQLFSPLCITPWKSMNIGLKATVLLSTVEFLLEYIFICNSPSVCVSCASVKRLPLCMRDRNTGKVTMNYVLESQKV